MAKNTVRVTHLLVLVSTIYMCALIGCRYYKDSTKPSMLIEDANLSKKLNSNVLSDSYRILTRNEKWNNDPKKMEDMSDSLHAQ